jgi:transposase
MTEGRDAATEKAFTSELTEHQCSLDAIKEAAMDMSPAFRSGFAEHLPEAVTVFDRYHVMAPAGKATDEVRKEVGREEGGTWKKARCGRFEATRSASRRGNSRSANGSAGITRIWGAR